MQEISNKLCTLVQLEKMAYWEYRKLLEESKNAKFYITPPPSLREGDQYGRRLY